MRTLSSQSRLSFSAPRRLRERIRARLRVELLESRTLLSAYPLSPGLVRHAYGFDQLSATGAGQTIAIIDAYDDPNVFADLDTFDQTYGWGGGGSGTLYQQFGASATFLTKATPQGRTRPDSGWAGEISLDVQWAHAIAPAAHILLVEARSASLTNLLNAVDYAVNHGATAVSMSWGSGEFSGETSYDSHFNHTGVTFVTSSGDSPGSEWPAVSPNVVAVGGTTLTVDNSGNYGNETNWSNQYGASGGGTSPYEPKPGYQSGVTSGSHRVSPDVAYDGDPVTGFAVYDSYAGGGGWGQYGGTSAGAPQWAALIALANQGRTTTLSSSGTLNALYSVYGTSNYSTYFHDVTGNGASSGYDLVTGLGSPKANTLVPFLQGVSANVATSGKGTAAISAASSQKPKSIATTPALEQVLLNFQVNPAALNANTTANVAVGGSQVATIPARIAPVVLPSLLVAQVRQESGGGQNEVFVLNEDMSEIPDILPVIPAPANPALAPVRGAPADPVPEARGTAELSAENCTAYFATHDALAAPTLASNTEALPVTAANADQAVEPAAALAIAFLLGSYGGRQSEADSRKSSLSAI